MELFSITCTTCRARLKVRDVAAIGQILGCPKCGSMVQVAPPEGWQAPADQAASSSSGALSDSSKSQLGGSKRWRDEMTPAERSKTAEIAAGAVAGSAAAGAAGDQAVRKRSPWRDPMPEGEPAATAPSSPAWIKWTLFAGLPTLAVVAAVSVWFWSSRRPAPQPAPVAASVPPTPPNKHEPPPAKSPAAEEPAEPASEVFNRRWLPAATRALLSLQWRRLNEHPASQTVLYRLGSVWKPPLAPLLAKFELMPQQVGRLTWIGAELDAAEGSWRDTGLVVIELAPDSEWQRPASDQAEKLDWQLDGAAVYRSSLPEWPHPFAIIDDATIVTGAESLLKELADRSEPGLQNADLARLLDQLDFQQSAVGAVDLVALREANAMPEWLPLVDVWHVSRDDWQVVRETPRALGVELALDERLDAELRLACQSETESEQVRAALDRLLDAMQKTMAGEVDSLTAKLLSGQMTTADAGRFKRLLSAGSKALTDRESGIEADVVWARTPWQGDLPALAVAALGAVPELEASRLAAARPLDEQNQLLLLKGLTGYEKAEGALPFGAADASLLPPETRLSWIATLLPYYDRMDWHDELNFSRSWNDAHNSRVTRRPLELTINPALGPGLTEAGFPVTHYVGLAGLGADAGLLETSDPRAGAFGYRRQASLAEMGDGASNSIALMGVSNKLGAWAAGGEATVRPLTTRPYVNGPDGFGSGQPDGMLAGMADGSTRFLSKDIDPAVLEALATINGGEKLPPEFGGPRAVAKSTIKPVEEMPAAPEPEAEPMIRLPRVDDRPRVDVNARLNDPVPELEFGNTPLIDAIQLLSQLSTAPINLDLEALAQAGVSPQQKISLTVTDTTIGGALSAVLEKLGLIYVVVDDQVLVTNAGRREQKLERFSFDVGDLTGNRAEQDLAELVERFVEPTAWQEAGGQGSIKRDGRRLVGQQTKEVVRHVEQFLDKLRLARGKPLSDDSGKRPRSLATRYAAARHFLETRVTANFNELTPLTELADHLRKAAEVQILFDGLALSAVGLSDRSEGRLVVADQPLSEALVAMLEPLQLSFRLADNDAIIITTSEAARDRLETEFYPVKPLLTKGLTPEALIERIESEIAPRSWRDAGGGGDLQFDRESDCLIVLQTQAQQIEIERLLQKLKPQAAAQ